ncbi:hypothetical protein [Burkholderia cenocepacia]|uniref:hypothetical protein n=1 Tax=Burkholderia cenocepacia TaxID=95486 RepID=UPI001CF42A08|nr:hypothetical protein [Burkholderia cenocepacia]MCA8239086.1 hypothetical protein [Burkholderia cenocepacia]
MDWLTFIASLFKSIAELAAAWSWPLAVGFCAYIFKAEIRAKLKDIRSFKAPGGFEASFTEELAEVEASFDSDVQIQLEGVAAQGRAGNLGLVFDSDAAHANPAGVIMVAWRDIELELRRLVYESATPGPSGAKSWRAISAILNELRQNRVLDENQVEILKHLQRLRNKAAHEPDAALSKEAVDRYTVLARRMLFELENKTPPPVGH